jgi:hypothetical protein
MPDGFVPFVSGEESAGAANVKIDRGRVRAIVAQLEKYGKSGAKSAAGSALSSLTGVTGISALLNIPSIFSTKGHIKRLKQLQTDIPYSCTCGYCDDIVEFAIQKKESKLVHKTVGSIPIVAWGETTRAAVRHFSKKKAGDERKTMAQMLWANAKNSNAVVKNEDEVSLMDFTQSKGDCVRAKAIIAELMGNFHEIGSWEKAEAVVSVQFGPSLIADKLQAV